MKSTRTWFLIADGSRARVVVNEGPGKGVRPAMDHEFATSSAPSREWGADRPGRAGGPGGTGHAKEPRIDLHDFAKERFAAEMAAMLDEAAGRRAYDRLILVAPPKVLGNLRSALKNGARERIAGELSKDLTHVAIRDLAGHLETVLPI
ncbi:MAG: host attachment protein [Magnetospirillum sp. WYHS-4]